jgi:hypothetical protein
LYASRALVLGSERQHLAHRVELKRGFKRNVGFLAATQHGKCLAEIEEGQRHAGIEGCRLLQILDGLCRTLLLQ